MLLEAACRAWKFAAWPEHPNKKNTFETLSNINMIEMLAKRSFLNAWLATTRDKIICIYYKRDAAKVATYRARYPGTHLFNSTFE